MFPERHSIIYDPKNRYIDLEGMKNLPGWKNIGEWKEKNGILECYIGWMAMFDKYYMAWLGQHSGLKIQNNGKFHNPATNTWDESPIFPIKKWVGPQPDLPLSECNLI